VKCCNKTMSVYGDAFLSCDVCGRLYQRPTAPVTSVPAKTETLPSAVGGKAIQHPVDDMYRFERDPATGQVTQVAVTSKDYIRLGRRNALQELEVYLTTQLMLIQDEIAALMQAPWIDMTGVAQKRGASAHMALILDLVRAKIKAD
jgi:hypothetical protein